MSGPIALIPPQVSTPAPNAYHPNMKMLARSAPIYSMSSRWQERSQENKVCAQTYSPNYTSVTPESFAFSCRARHPSCFHRTGPAPNAYAVNDSQTVPRAPASTLASRRRFFIDSTPAPNAYSVKFSETQRRQPDAVFAAPRRDSVFRSATARISSATYQTNFKLLKPSPQSFSMRSRTPLVMNKDQAAGVGPAKYSQQQSMPKGKGFTMSGWCSQGFNIW